MSCSFDIQSRLDMQEVQNAVHQAVKEIQTRYDFKGSPCSITLDQTAGKITLEAEDEFKRKAVQEVLEAKLVRRKVSTRALEYGKVIEASHKSVRQEVTLIQGIPIEKARAIVKSIKDMKKKSVQASIQGDELRVTGKSRDDLQEVITHLRSQDFGVELQFTNYRG